MAEYQVAAIREYVLNQISDLYLDLRDNAESDRRVITLKDINKRLEVWDGMTGSDPILQAWLQQKDDFTSPDPSLVAQWQVSSGNLNGLPIEIAPILPTTITPPPADAVADSASQVLSALEPALVSRLDPIANATNDLQSEDPNKWRNAIEMLQLVASGAPQTQKEEIGRLINMAQGKFSRHIVDLYRKARLSRDNKEKRNLLNQILQFSFQPDGEEANQLLAGLDRQEQRAAEVARKKSTIDRALKQLTDSQGSRLKQTQILEELRALDDLLRDEDYADDEELQSLRNRLQIVYDEVRQAQGVLVTAASQGHHKEALEALDALIKRGDTEFETQAGSNKFVDAGTRRRQIIDEYRNFVHTKIHDKINESKTDVEHQPEASKQLLVEAEALYQEFVKTTGDVIPEDRALNETLEKELRAVEPLVQAYGAAKVKIEESNKEGTSLRSRYTLLTQAQEIFAKYPNIHRWVMDAARSYTNAVAASVDGQLESIRTRAPVAVEQHELTELLQRLEENVTKLDEVMPIADTEELQKVLRKRSEVSTLIVRRQGFMRLRSEIESTLDKSPPDVVVAKSKLALIKSQYSEYEIEVKDVEVLVQSFGDDEEQLKAAANALSLGEAERALTIVGKVSGVQYQAQRNEITARATIIKGFNDAALHRRNGKFKEATTIYNRLATMELDDASQIKLREAREETQSEERNQVEIEKLHKGAVDLWGRNKRVEAVQALNKAYGMPGGPPIVGQLLDTYKTRWRDLLVAEFETWLKGTNHSDWQTMETKAEEANKYELLIREEDRHLASKVEQECRRQWALTAELEVGNATLAQHQLRDLEDIANELPDLANSIPYRYRIAQACVLQEAYDKANDHIKIALKIIGSRDINSRTQSGMAIQKNARRETTVEELQALQSEINLSKEISNTLQRVGERLTIGQPIDYSTIEELRGLQNRVESLKIAKLLRQQVTNEMVERVVHKLVEQAKYQQANGLNAAVLSYYHWALTLLEKNGNQFLRDETTSQLNSHYTSLPHVLDDHLKEAEDFEHRLKGGYRLSPVGELLQEAKNLKERTEAILAILDRIKNIDTYNIKPQQMNSVRATSRSLAQKESQLSALTRKVKLLQANYDNALKLGKIAYNANEVFAPVEDALGEIGQDCTGYEIKIQEFEELNRRLTSNIGASVPFPVKKGKKATSQPNTFDEEVRFEPNEYDVLPRQIGDKELYSKIHEYLHYAMVAWGSEEFAYFDRIAAFIARFDQQDRYKIADKLNLTTFNPETYGTSTIQTLKDAQVRAKSFLSNHEQWVKLRDLRRKDMDDLKSGWETTEPTTRIKATPANVSDDPYATETPPPIPTLEARLNDATALLDRAKTASKEDQVGRGQILQMPAGIMTQSAKEVADDANTYLSSIRTIEAVIQTRVHHLEAAIDQRNASMRKLDNKESFAPGESENDLYELLKVLDPDNPVVIQYLYGPPPEEQRPWWKRLLKFGK